MVEGCISGVGQRRSTSRIAPCPRDPSTAPLPTAAIAISPPEGDVVGGEIGVSPLLAPLPTAVIATAPPEGDVVGPCMAGEIGVPPLLAPAAAPPGKLWR